MTVGGRVGALWIGGLEPYMDEAFLQVSEAIKINSLTYQQFWPLTHCLCKGAFLIKMRIVCMILLLAECHEHDGRVGSGQH